MRVGVASFFLPFVDFLRGAGVYIFPKALCKKLVLILIFILSFHGVLFDVVLSLAIFFPVWFTAWCLCMLGM